MLLELISERQILPYLYQDTVIDTAIEWMKAAKASHDSGENPVWLTFVERRYEWMGEFARFVTAYSKEVMPHASVQHNCAHTAAGNWNAPVTSWPSVVWSRCSW